MRGVRRNGCEKKGKRRTVEACGKDGGDGRGEDDGADVGSGFVCFGEVGEEFAVGAPVTGLCVSE